MREAIRMLCALSLLCSVAHSLAPEESGKRAISFVCAVVMLAGCLSFLRSPDWEAYALELGQLRAREERYLRENEEKLRSLDRRVIEAEYGAYILDMAAERDLALKEVKVQAQWSMEGLWLPSSVEITGEAAREERVMLEKRIEAELGIPRDRQLWRTEDG